MLRKRISAFHPAKANWWRRSLATCGAKANGTTYHIKGADAKEYLVVFKGRLHCFISSLPLCSLHNGILYDRVVPRKDPA
jgi:hypothetical protein